MKKKPFNLNNCFGNNNNITSFIIEHLDTSSVVNLANMFQNCSNLQTLELPYLDVRNLDDDKGQLNANGTGVMQMCKGCSTLEKVNLCNWNFENIEYLWTCFYGMFNNCNSLTEIILDGWVLPEVSKSSIPQFNFLSSTIYSINIWVNGCSQDTIDKISYMFNTTRLFIRQTDEYIENVYIKHDSYNYKHYGYSKINAITNETVEFVTLNKELISITPRPQNYIIIEGSCNSIQVNGETISSTSEDIENGLTLPNPLTTISQMFKNKTSVTSIDFNIDTSEINDMNSMFYGCTTLTTIAGIENWNTSNVTTMFEMFRNCNLLETKLNLSNWNVSNVETMQNMFFACRVLTEIDVTGWRLSNATTIRAMFSGCNNLKTIKGIKDWDISGVNTVRVMFANCWELEEIDLSGWNTSNLTSIYGLFSTCRTLTTINLSGWDLSNVGESETVDVFKNCNALTTIYMRGCNQTTIELIDSLKPTGCTIISE